MAKTALRFRDAVGVALRKLTIWVSGAEADLTTSPTITAGTGAPSATEPAGSLYLRTSGTVSVYYTTGSGTWIQGAGAGLDLNGAELILDADADTSLTADTDDQIDVKISGADDFRFTANTFAALAGSSITADTIAETTGAAGVTVDGVLLKDGGAVFADGATIEVDTVNEATAAAGVTVDGLRIKDAAITPAAGGSAWADLSACATGEADVVLGDNLADALTVREGANTYLTLVTTDDAERVTFGKLVAHTVVTVDMADAAHALVLGTAGAGQTKLTGNVIFCDPNSGGASEDLTLPAEASSAGLVLHILNTGGEGIVVKDDGAGTVITLDTAQHGIVVCNGTEWRGFIGGVT